MNHPWNPKSWMAKIPSLEFLKGVCSEQDCSCVRGIRGLVKGSAKGIWLSGRHYCSAECFQNAVERACRDLLPQATSSLRERNRFPIGLILLSRGAISQTELRSALDAQRLHGYGRLGEWLKELALVDERELAKAISDQCGCPVLGVDTIQFPSCDLLPLALLRAEQMVPVHFSSPNGLLYLAFADRLKRSVVYGVETMLGCRVEPCIVTESALADALGQIEKTVSGSEVVFTSVSSREIASIIRNYAIQGEAEEAGVVVCGQALWARLKARNKWMHLLFQSGTQSLPRADHSYQPSNETRVAVNWSPGAAQ